MAARLFVTHGLRATRAEDIAQAAGVAPRTFYRYFATKEEAVGPLFGAGTELWAQAVREAPAGLSVPQALEHAVRHVLTPGAAVSLGALDWARTLLRLAQESPGLLRVWTERCREAEHTLAQALASRGAGPAHPRRASRPPSPTPPYASPSRPGRPGHPGRRPDRPGRAGGAQPGDAAGLPLGRRGDVT